MPVVHTKLCAIVSCMRFLLPIYANHLEILWVNQVREEAQQLAMIFETVGAFKIKRKGGKGKLIFGT